MIEVKQIPILSDNYSYLIIDKKTNTTCCVDPSVGDDVIKVLKKNNLNLDFILNTHHHSDHVGGNKILKENYNCQVIGSFYDQERIPEIDIKLKHNEKFNVGTKEFKIIETPGHTIGHICYYFKSDGLLFSGDTLFSLGCGRLFEGSYGQMVKSLSKLRALPKDTRIFCGHEYTESNAKFAIHLDSKSLNLKEKFYQIIKKREKSISTIPSTLDEEIKFNPFMKYDNEEYLKIIGIENVSDEENFKKIRLLKDRF